MYAGAGLPHRWMHRKAEVWGPRALLVGCVTGAALTLGGCATQYRPVVAAINPVGPAAQPTKYAFAVSDPNELNAAGTLNGLLTLVDVSGDTTLATPSIIPKPTYFAYSASNAIGFVINAQNSLNSVYLGSPQSLITSQVVTTTLPTGANAPSLSGFAFGSAGRILVPEIGTSAVSIFSATSPALQQQISVTQNPVYVVGSDGTPRAYVISQGAAPGTSTGQVAAIEASSLSVSATIPVGLNPVYGVETTDNRRAFILNSGSGTVSVINVTNNATDSAHPTISLDPGGKLGLQPVWADIATSTNQLVVVSRRANDANGYLSIINIPLCNALAQPTNSTCDPTNPNDAANFGQVLATVPVGINPTQVSALSDGSQAYVSNEGDRSPASGPQIEGSVSAVNLVSGQVQATITAVTAFTAAGVTDPINPPTCGVIATATAASQACVYGHPTTIASTTGTPTGKVYVTSPDNNYMTVIETDTDTVVTHINLQGTGVRVQVSTR